MTTKENKEFFQLNGNPIAQNPRLKAGNYLGRKDNDNLRIVGEYDKGEDANGNKILKWQPVTNKTDKVVRSLAFATVTDMKSNLPVDISVPSSFMDVPLKAVFQFKINDRGYSEVNTNKLTEKEVEAYLSDEV